MLKTKSFITNGSKKMNNSNLHNISSIYKYSNMDSKNVYNVDYLNILYLKYLFLNKKYFIFMDSLKHNNNFIEVLLDLNKKNLVGCLKIRSVMVSAIFKKSSQIFNFLKGDIFYLAFTDKLYPFFSNSDNLSNFSIFSFIFGDHLINPIYLSKLHLLYFFYKKNYIIIYLLLFNFIMLFLVILRKLNFSLILCLKKFADLKK